MYKRIASFLAAAVMAASMDLSVCSEGVTAKGDLNGDGMVNVTDVSKAAAHVKGTKPLDDASSAAADINDDGAVNVTDVSLLAACVKGLRTLDGDVIETRSKAQKILDGMSLHEKVCQMFIVAPESLTGADVVTKADGKIEDALQQEPVGGLIFFASNLESVSQTEDLIFDVQEFNSRYSDAPLFISVDEEGGTVARCAEKLGTTSFENMYNYREAGTETAKSNAKTIAEDISKLGFNLDFAPVADTWSNPENTVIGERAYSTDFSETAELVVAAVEGFNEGGVACTLKHFPGHGDTATDSHLGMACSYKTIEELGSQEYLAFESGIDAGADMVMVGHITMTNIDNLPATISPTMIKGELRGKLGFDGVVITDALAMGAVANYYESGELAVKCVQAGDDILLMPADLSAAVKGIEDAVSDGTLTEARIDESVLRILELKEKRGML